MTRRGGGRRVRCPACRHLWDPSTFPDHCPVCGPIKRCNACRRRKSLAAFHRDRRAKDGHKGACKACVSKRTKRWAAKNRDRKNGTDREWKRRNRAKDRAHGIVRRAIASGLLVPAVLCDRCGESHYMPDMATKCPLQIEAHHPDYTKPLHVEWLCKACHMAHHGAQR